ncbi:MAG: alkaline shock response membrane anchor protein AmaP [Candidatus Omnitrophota bacterium]
MRLIKGFFILVCMFFFVGLGGILIYLSLNLIAADDIANLVNYVYTDPNVRMGVGIAGAVLVIIGLLIGQINFGKMQQEKTIAFENPEGQVTVSLAAIEDFIKKSIRRMPEVKELKSIVTASKKGINVVCRATIFSDSNIPETTERIQNLIKSKVKDMLGVEETINIKINVNKISSKGRVEQQPPEGEPEEVSRRMPFAD